MEEQGSAVQLVVQWANTRLTQWVNALPGLLGHGFPGDPHHTQGSPGNEAAGHPQFTPELGGHR
jgi:hypothetical protein